MLFLTNLFLTKKVLTQNELDNNLIKECKKCSNTNNLKKIKLLIENGANIDTQDKYVFEDPKGIQLLSTGQTTPLMFACMLRSIKVVKFLLENGANPNLKSSTEQTALIMATIRGRFEIVKLLLKNGADLASGAAEKWATNFLNIHSMSSIIPYPSFNIPIPLYIFQSLNYTKTQIKEYNQIKNYLILWKNVTFIQRRYRRKLQQRIGEIELLSKTRIPRDVIKEIIQYI